MDYKTYNSKIPVSNDTQVINVNMVKFSDSMYLAEVLWKSKFGLYVTHLFVLQGRYKKNSKIVIYNRKNQPASDVDVLNKVNIIDNPNYIKNIAAFIMDKGLNKFGVPESNEVYLNDNDNGEVIKYAFIPILIEDAAYLKAVKDSALNDSVFEYLTHYLDQKTAKKQISRVRRRLLKSQYND